MPKEASGETRFRGGVWTTRIRLHDGERVSFSMPWCKSKPAAKVRAKQLAELGRQLLAASVEAEATHKVLTLVASAATEQALRLALQAAPVAVGQGLRPVTGAPKVPTVQELGERWTSGKLAKQYPDHIRLKRSVDDDISRFTNHIYPVIGPIPIDQVTLERCEEVMRKLPESFEVTTRRNVGQLITRLLSFAVYPLRLIPKSPIPKGFLPTIKKKKAFACLYPDEDRRLLACTDIAWEWRVLWGFLPREGMRSDEATSMTWSDLDLVRGAVRLDENKTDDPRAWALHPGTTEALRMMRARRPNAKPTDHVFLRPEGMAMAAVKGGHLAEWLRKHLKRIGLHHERPELFVSTADRRQIRVHDLRGTFVTVSLANGKSEAWIGDRTGHKSSTMIATYKRNARTFEELGLGDLTPLNEALPEFRNGDTRLSSVPEDSRLIAPGLPPRTEGAQKTGAISMSSAEREKGFEAGTHPQDHEIIRESGSAWGQTGPISDLGGHSGGNGDPITSAAEAAESTAPPALEATPAAPQTADVVAPTDPVEAALSEALRRATEAGQWSTVEVLARELGAHAARRAGAAQVVDLDSVRRRRDLK